MDDSIRRSPRLIETMQVEESEPSIPSDTNEDVMDTEYSISEANASMYATPSETESLMKNMKEMLQSSSKSAMNKPTASGSKLKKRNNKSKKNIVKATDWTPQEIRESYNSIKNSHGEWDTNWDKLRKEIGQATNVDAGLGSRLPTTTRNIYLIRHGQYNKDTDDDGEDTLTELGLSQAAETGARMAKFGITFNRLIHSTMSRARETAENIAQHIFTGKKMERCDLLREGCPNEPVPKLRGYKPSSCVIHKDEYRIEAAYRKYMYRADVTQKHPTHDVLICHGNVIRYFVCRAMQFSTEGWLRLNIYNASITHIAIEGDGKVCLKTYGDSGHMAPQQLTTD